jgi:cytochrome c-type biogenesis protein CcmF
MLPEIGFGALVLAFTAAVYSVLAALLGERHQRADLVESARRSQLLTWPLLTISAVSLIGLLVNNRFDVSFVYEVTSRSMPTYLKITAWWGGQAGSLVFWAWLMAAFASLVTLRKWDRDAEFLPWVIVVTSTTLAFFLGLVIFAENPFARYWQTMSGDVVERMFRPGRHASVCASGWPGAEPAASPSRDDRAPSAALPGVCLLRHSLCLCHGYPDHRPHG